MPVSQPRTDQSSVRAKKLTKIEKGTGHGSRAGPLAPVPGKPISANRGLNLANPGLKFILRLDSVPESTINTNLGINEGLNLIHLARSIKVAEHSFVVPMRYSSLFSNRAGSWAAKIGKMQVQLKKIIF